jgi:hypothetical protein
MDHVDTMRIVSSPMDFTLRDKSKTDSALMFFETCLIELYLHEVISGLKRVRSIAVEYADEFSCRWKYYAASKRIDSIREYGGEPEDYDDEGNITPASDKRLKLYSPVSDIRPDCRDIFMSAELSDLTTLFSAIAVDSRMDVNDFFRSLTGKRLKSYRKEDGEMVENTWIDESLMKARREFIGEELSDILMRTLFRITELVREIKGLEPDNDHRSFFVQLPRRIDRIFNLDFDK